MFTINQVTFHFVKSQHIVRRFVRLTTAQHSKKKNTELSEMKCLGFFLHMIIILIVCRVIQFHIKQVKTALATAKDYTLKTYNYSTL